MSTEEERVVTSIIQQNFDLEEIPVNDEMLQRVRALLIDKINFLLDHDFEKLLWILYRVDVSEERAKSTLAEKSDQPPTELLADLIIQRQMEKAKTRLKYRQDRPEE